MSLFSNTGKSNIYLIFVILAILTSLITKLTAKYEKDIVFRVIVEDHEDEKFIYKKSHDSLMLRVRGYGFNLAKYYLESPELRISIKKLKEDIKEYRKSLNDTEEMASKPSDLWKKSNAQISGS